jgi:putative transposase
VVLKNEGVTGVLLPSKTRSAGQPAPADPRAAHARIRYGYKRIHILLKREGVHVNKKRVHRLYALEGLQLRPRRPRRNVSAARRQPSAVRATAPNTAWAMDFVADQLQDGRRFRALTLVDVFTRENLAIHVGLRLGGDDVVNVLRRVAAKRGSPRRIYCDNGSEFAGRSVDLWAYANQVTLEFSRPGKPTDNAFIESFNGSLRDECLNTHWFSSFADAQEKLEAWRTEYNGSRPHKARNGRTPHEYRADWAQRKSETL